MNKFATFKSYLMKKEHDLSGDKENSEVSNDIGDHDEKNGEKAEDKVIEKNSSAYILGENKDNLIDSDSDSVDNLPPPPGIPVKKKKNRKSISLWNQRKTRGWRKQNRTKMG